LFAYLWHALGQGQQMSLAGTGTLRQYEDSMLPTRASSRRSTVSSVSAAKPSLRSALRARAGVPLARSTASLALRIGAPLVLLVQAITSCGSDDPAASVCVPNESQACTGASQCVGFQVCAEDGKSFGACDCGSGSGNGGTSSGSGGSGGGGGGTSNAGTSGMGSGPLFPGVVGSPCATDADCAGAPVVCVQESSNTEFQFGGPQDGYCSLPCTANADCTAIDGDAACNTGLGYCLALCQPGVGATLVKCGAGRAQYCFPISDDGSIGACLPGCTSDAACAGRFCDPGLPGLCVDEAPPGGAVGAACTVATQVADCASGLCLEYADPNDSTVTVATFCSANCTAGVANGCGFDAVSGGTRQAACFEPRFSDGGVGDIGVCFPLCDTTADCAQAAAGWTCLPFPDPAGVAQVGRQGECVPPDTGAGVADAGPG
jgi:hypothetical protein